MYSLSISMCTLIILKCNIDYLWQNNELPKVNSLSKVFIIFKSFVFFFIYDKEKSFNFILYYIFSGICVG